MALFHIGYHKTATTCLQRFLFEAHPQVFHRVGQRAIHDALILPGPLNFELDQAHAFVQGEIDRATTAGQIAVFSNERLSGSFNNGGYDVLDIMQRIAACDEQAHILLVIREQRSILRSLYSQYVRAYGCCSLEEFLNGQHTTHNKELFQPWKLEYHRLIKACQQQFGTDRVTVVPYEWLKHDPQALLEAVLDAAGVDPGIRSDLHLQNAEPVNTASGPLQIAVKRRLNPLLTSSAPHIGSTFQFGPTRWLARAATHVAGRLPLKRLNQRISARQNELIETFCHSHYPNSNRFSEKFTGLPLSSLGYLQDTF